MKKCPKCGTENNDNAKFCIKCGHKFTLNSNPKTAQQNSNVTMCPNCGKPNPKTAKFCRYCGHQLATQPNPQPNMYTRQQYQSHQYAQQPNPQLAQANNFLTGYYQWFKNSLLGSNLHKNSNPYYGATSFGIIVVLLWIAEILSKDSYRIFDQITNLFGSIPINSYFDIFSKADIKSPIWLLILTLLTIITYWVVAYLSDLMINKNQNSIFTVSNQLASATNAATLTSLLIVISAVINEPVLVWLFVYATKIIFITGLFYVVFEAINSKRHQVMFNGIYLGTLACIVSYIVQGLIMAFASNLMG